MVTMEIVKSQFLSYNNGCYEQKKPLSKLEFHELQLHLKKLIKWVSADLDQMLEPQKSKFLETGCKN